MPSGSFWSRIRKAQLFQVLLVYGGACWLVLQVVDVLRDTLLLPEWVGPVAFILLLVGLIIILATAWVQSHPLIEQRERSEEVPESWELDLGEAVKSLTTGRLPHLNWARALAGGIFAFSLLFGIAGMYVVVKDRGASFAPREARAEAAPDGIAVLPFTVRGAALEDWREGMVDLLSTGLDGAGGLRAIASRTVLARWGELVGDSIEADERTALTVARSAGARYAVLGSAVAIGPDVRLSAEVYSLDDARPLGVTEPIEGPPDSVLSLVDQLAVKTLGLILRRDDGDLPSVDLASLTTASLPALKAYLEGEALFRRGDFAAATEAYERAVRQDSLFALAYHRLAQAYGWTESIGSERGGEARARAFALIERLPERQALAVRGAQGVRTFDPGAATLLQEAVRKYPDDAELWYELGEAYLHVREGLAGWEEAEHAFERAVELAPRFAPYRIHLIEAAARYHADSVRLARHLDAYEQLAPNSIFVRRYRLVQTLAFGDSAARAAALAEIDRLPPGQQVRQVSFGINNPLFWEINERLIRSVYPRAPSEARREIHNVLAFTGLFQRGYLRRAMETARDPAADDGLAADVAAVALELGVRVDAPELDSLLARAERGERLAFESAIPAATAGASTGRWRAHAAGVARLRTAADSLAASGDPLGAERLRARARLFEGYGFWKRGETAEAIRIMEAARAGARDDAARWWLANIYRDLGRLGEAERYFRTLLTWDPDPLASYELGKIYQARGEVQKARERLEFFVANWASADPEFQPLVQDAKQRLVTLSGDRPR